MGSLVRKMQREQLKKQLKEAMKNPQSLQPPLATSNDLLVKDVENLKQNIRLLDNHIWMMVEALSDKGLLNWTDIHAVESKYIKREEIKRAKIKEYLETDKPLSQIINEINEGPDLKGYERLGIHPIKDLNLNPYEVANYLKELNPDLTKEAYVQLWSKWALKAEHFGFSDKPDAPSQEKQ